MLALLVCMAVGAINGFFVAVVGIDSFVVDARHAVRVRGLALMISHGTPVAAPGSRRQVGTFAKVFGGGTYSELIWA